MTGAHRPKRRIRRRRFRPRRGKRRFGKRRARIGRMIGFPHRRVVRLRYCTYLTLDAPNTGTLVFSDYRANGLFDPEVGVGGHQPLGFDQWCLFYKKYIVLGSRITCSVSASAVGTTNPAIFGIQLVEPQSTVPSNWDLIIEQGKTKYRILQVAANGLAIPSVSMNFSSKKWFGYTNAKDNVILYGAQAGSSPTDPALAGSAYFRLIAGAIDQASDINPIQLVIKIEYIAMFFEPLQLPRS